MSDEKADKPYQTNCPRCHSPISCEFEVGAETWCPNGCGRVYIALIVGPIWIGRDSAKRKAEIEPSKEIT